MATTASGPPRPADLGKKYAALPARENLCRPLSLLERIRLLGCFAQRQLAQAKDLRQQGLAGEATLATQAMVFSCYQLMSHVVALQCWAQYQAECVSRQALFIDNLTGLLLPGAERRKYALGIQRAVLPLPAHRRLARRIYRLTSALLHNYPHLAHSAERPSFPYQDLNGVNHYLENWREDDLLAAVEAWLTDIA